MTGPSSTTALEPSAAPGANCGPDRGLTASAVTTTQGCHARGRGNWICGRNKSWNDELRIQKMQVTLPAHFPRRRAQGRMGSPIQLTANHFVEIPAG
ncbi:hypothetical protein MTO96_013179 [Rhipicephalus appendiculatus]